MTHPTVSEEDARILQPLSINGGHIFSIDHVGRNLFHKAVIWNRLDLCKICIKYFDINCKTRDGLTPICYTLNGRSKDINLIKFLLDEGADVNSIGHRGEPAYQRIIGSNISLKVVKLFHQYGLNTNGVLHFLCQKSHPPIGILKHFTIPSITSTLDEYGKYPLAYAIEYLSYDNYIEDLCKHYNKENVVSMCYMGDVIVHFERRLKLITEYGGSINTIINNKTIVHMLIDHTLDYIPNYTHDHLMSVVPLLAKYQFNFRYQIMHRTSMVQVKNQTFLNYVIVNWLSKQHNNWIFNVSSKDFLLKFISGCMKQMTPEIINIPDYQDVPPYWHFMFYINMQYQNIYHIFSSSIQSVSCELIIVIINQFYRYGGNIMQPMNGMFASEYLSTITYGGHPDIVGKNIRMNEWLNKIRDAVKANEEKTRIKAATTIQQVWRVVAYDPDFMVCKKRCRAIQEEWDRSAKRIRSLVE